MEIDSREEKNALAFLDYVSGMGGYKLRPLGYLTTENLALLEMSMTRGQAAFAELDTDQVRDEVHAYLFIQSAPVPDVSRAIRGYRMARKTQPREVVWEKFITEIVEPFLATLAPEHKRDLEEQLENMEEVSASRVDAVPPPGQKTEREIPNS